LVIGIKDTSNRIRRIRAFVYKKAHVLQEYGL